MRARRRVLHKRYGHARNPNLARLAILDEVVAVMDQAEEIGGPDGAEYVGLMDDIMAEAQTRRAAYLRRTGGV